MITPAICVHSLMRGLYALALSLLALTSFAQALPRRGTLGVALRAVPADVQTKYNLRPQSAVLVAAGPDHTFPGDLKEGDILTEIDGKTWTTFGEMNDIIRDLKVGVTVTLTGLADGKPVKRRLALIERPRDKGDKYDVVYDSVVSNGHRIRTIISKPKSPGRHPVLFWIQGINTGSVDLPLTSTNSNTVILKTFADEGWVTVRVEKPGVGDSEGGPAIKVGFDEEVDIYRQALKSLDGYDYMDRSKVYIFGHSMGGCHAPILAAEIPVKGIITYGTVSDSWLEWEIKAARWQSLLAGGDPVAVDKQVRQIVTFYDELFTQKKTIAEIKKAHPDLAALADDQSPDGETLAPRSIRYMQELNDHNFSHHWDNIGNAKVLALFGANDYISLEADQTQIPFIVNRKHPGNASFQKLAGCDHLFFQTTSFQDSMKKINEGGGQFNPDVTKAIQTWIALQERS